MKSTKFPEGMKVRFKPNVAELFKDREFGLSGCSFLSFIEENNNPVFVVQHDPNNYSFNEYEPTVYVGKFKGRSSGRPTDYIFPEDWFIRVGNEVEVEE